MLFLLLVYVFMKLNLKLRFIQDSMSTTPMISCSRIVRYESGSHTVGNRSNINILFRIFNVNIIHLKPCVSYLEYGNALGVWRSSSLLLYSLCTSLETDDISSWSEWYVSVVYSCWFLDDGNIHSYRIRYHDSCLGRAIKKLCFLDSVFMLLRVRSVSVPRCINAVEPAVQSGNAIKKISIFSNRCSSY